VVINKRRAAMEKKVDREKRIGYRGRNTLHITIISTWNEFRGLSIARRFTSYTVNRILTLTYLKEYFIRKLRKRRT
jgi:hypothetical protein